MKKEINIRRATIKDLKIVCELEKIFINHLLKNYQALRDLHHPSLLKGDMVRKLLKKILKKRNGGYFILEENKKPIGLSEFVIKKAEEWTRFKKEGYIAEIFILKKYRKKGYGKLLTKHIMDYLKNRGCDLLKIAVDMGNEPAHKLYSKLKFKDKGIMMYKPIKK